MNDERPGIVGYSDGVKGSEVFGWAWRPDYPDQPVEVELWVDDELFAETTACDYRPDLRAAGIGHGRYGWRLPLPADAQSRPAQILVRVKDGEPLPNGRVSTEAAPSQGDLDDHELQAFVAAVLGRVASPDRPEPAPSPPVHFLLHAPVGVEPSSLGLPEYSYGFVMKAFEPLLRQLGQVHVLSDPEAEADRLHGEHIARGETSVLLSFAPPQRTTLGLRCPVIPVIAWEFPTIPDRVWADDRRHDWRFVLRQTGRAITLSSFAAQAVKRTMGPDFPVVSAPAPVWDRFSDLHGLPVREPGQAAELSIDGFVFDTRGRTFEPTAATPPLAMARAATAEVTDAADDGQAGLASTVLLDGVVFTAVFSPKDGRKNWPDMVTAFIAAHTGAPGATLVLKMIGYDPALWWWELHDVLGRLPPFACRLVVLHGYLTPQAYNGLIAASHWVVCASRAEGMCMPLVEFMSCGRPAISPSHTAMADYISPAGALVVESDEEYCGWPHDPLNEMTTTRHRVSWPSMVEAFAGAYAITTCDPARYAQMSAAAGEAARAYCSDATVAATLDGFLGLDLGRAKASATPSALLAIASA